MIKTSSRNAVLWTTTALAGCVLSSALCATEFKSTKPSVRIEHWQRRADDIDAHLRSAKDLGAVKLLFVGDSISDFWLLDDNPWVKGQKFGRQVWDQSFDRSHPENYGLNLGISGDRIEHVLKRLAPRSEGGDGQLDNPALNPEFIVLLIGINNTWDAEEPVADSVFEGIRTVIARLHKARPHAHIVLQSLLPTNDPPKNAAVVVPVNQRLAVLAASSSYASYLSYLDLFSAFVDAKGQQIEGYFNDGLHPNAAGYRVWRDQLVPFLQQARRATRPVAMMDRTVQESGIEPMLKSGLLFSLQAGAIGD